MQGDVDVESGAFGQYCHGLLGDLFIESELRHDALQDFIGADFLTAYGLGVSYLKMIALQIKLLTLADRREYGVMHHVPTE